MDVGRTDGEIETAEQASKQRESQPKESDRAPGKKLFLSLSIRLTAKALLLRMLYTMCDDCDGRRELQVLLPQKCKEAHAAWKGSIIHLICVWDIQDIEGGFLTDWLTDSLDECVVVIQNLDAFSFRKIITNEKRTTRNLTFAKNVLDQINLSEKLNIILRGKFLVVKSKNRLCWLFTRP